MNTVYRFLKRRDRCRGRGGEAVHVGEAPCDCQPEQTLLHEELDQAITGALARLTPELRGALVLTVFDGVAPAEVATIEGCSRATVYWRIHRARRALKKLLHEWM